MCNNDHLLGYLYDELEPADRREFEGHLATCRECREEIAGLRGTRHHLQSWSPPEPDLGFEIVRSAKVAQPRRFWQVSPAWGLAAAATLTLAVAAAIANVEVRAGSDGIVVSTGWSRGATAGQVQAAAAPSAEEYAAKLQAVTVRLQELEQQLAARPAAAVNVSTAAPSREEFARVARQLISESEQRQQTLLAQRMLQLSRDTEVQRRSDVDRMLIAMRQLQGTSYETSQRLDHLIRVGLQR